MTKAANSGSVLSEPGTKIGITDSTPSSKVNLSISASGCETGTGNAISSKSTLESHGSGVGDNCGGNRVQRLGSGSGGVLVVERAGPGPSGGDVLRERRRMQQAGLLAARGSIAGRGGRASLTTMPPRSRNVHHHRDRDCCVPKAEVRCGESASTTKKDSKKSISAASVIETQQQQQHQNHDKKDEALSGTDVENGLGGLSGNCRSFHDGTPAGGLGVSAASQRNSLVSASSSNSRPDLRWDGKHWTTEGESAESSTKRMGMKVKHTTHSPIQGTSTAVVPGCAGKDTFTGNCADGDKSLSVTGDVPAAACGAVQGGGEVSVGVRTSVLEESVRQISSVVSAEIESGVWWCSNLHGHLIGDPGTNEADVKHANEGDVCTGENAIPGRELFADRSKLRKLPCTEGDVAATQPPSQAHLLAACVALERFSMDTIVPTLQSQPGLTRDLLRGGCFRRRRVFMAACLMLREVLVLNAEGIFYPTRKRVELASVRHQREKRNRKRIEDRGKKQILLTDSIMATAVMFSALRRLDDCSDLSSREKNAHEMKNDEKDPGETSGQWKSPEGLSLCEEFAGVLSDYQTQSGEFAPTPNPVAGMAYDGSPTRQHLLPQLDARHEGILPNGAALSAEENVAWRVGHNLARKSHPLNIGFEGAWHSGRKRKRRKDPMTVMLPPEPTACVVYMVENKSAVFERERKKNEQLEVQKRAKLDRRVRVAVGKTLDSLLEEREREKDNGKKREKEKPNDGAASVVPKSSLFDVADAGSNHSQCDSLEQAQLFFTRAERTYGHPTKLRNGPPSPSVDVIVIDERVGTTGDKNKSNEKKGSDCVTVDSEGSRYSSDPRGTVAPADTEKSSTVSSVLL